MATLRRLSLPPWALLFLALCVTEVLEAHPIPDIPVQAFFEADGSCVIRVEVDPRCFSVDPVQESYLLNGILQRLPADEKEVLLTKARDLVKRSVELRFEPLGRVDPEFVYRFTSHGDKPLQAVEDPVMITGDWRTKVPAGLEGYRVKA
ncbi:MAG: hypothetical protein ABL994_25155, partial [Verrucomicrobiales bacterium]